MSEPPRPGADLLDSEAAGPAAIRGSAMRTGGYVVGILLSLASAPLLIRHLGIEDFGRYTAVLALVVLVGGLTEGGLNAIALREVAASDRDRHDAIMANVLGLRLLLATATVLLAVVIAIAIGYESALVIGALGAALGLFVTLVQTLLVITLQGHLRFGWATLTELLRQSLTVAGLVVLVLAGGSLVSFLWLPLPVGVIVLAVTIPAVRGMMPLRPAFDRELWWSLLRDMLPYSAAVAANVVYFRVAVVIMSLVAGAEETGYFAASFRVIDVLVGVPALIVSAAFPILARASARSDDTRFTYAFGRLAELMLILGAALAIPLAVGADVVMDVLGGDVADPATPVLRIQAGAIVATCLALAAGHALLSTRRHATILVGNGAALVVATSLTLVLGRSNGAQGAAVATLAAELVLAGFLMGAMARATPAALGRDQAAGAVRVLAAAVPAVAVAFVPGIPSLVLAALSVAVFAGALAAVGRFPPELRDAVRARRGVV